jgi:glycosyltransferase involved in cell wall biosynthesis
LTIRPSGAAARSLCCGRSKLWIGREIRKDSLGAAAIVGHAGTAMRLMRYAGTLARFARAHGAVALHCNSLKSDFYGALAGRMARLPVVWHVRDHIDPDYLPGPVVQLFRALARSVPSAIVTNSDSSTEKLFPGGVPKGKLVATIYDGLADRELNTPLPTKVGFRHDPPRVGMVGRIVQWKGQHIFLQAARLLQERGIHAHYVIVGAPLFGEQAFETELHQMAEPLGESVEFLGFQSDIPAILANLDILIHASISPEPFGQVVIEGMAEGVPVIASDGGGVREIMAERGVDGMLTPMGDAPALADALGSLLSDPARAHQMACGGWKRVRTAFTARRTADGIAALYDRLLGASPATGAQKGAL